MQNFGPSHNDKLAEGYKNTLTHIYHTFKQRDYTSYMYESRSFVGVLVFRGFWQQLRSSCCLVLLERGAYADSMYVCT